MSPEVRACGGAGAGVSPDFITVLEVFHALVLI